ncbi:Hint domain-containing protein [Myxococcus sp. XM-1-1-1]|uniref:Hint domain-containing protein n=1 Tax=Myxococcus sp. XM-1-1-1 TaxID=2874602 RepID=UPI001CBB3A34|nr:Hint domain-containing protein [Myxococcus sp. XM-1-1-1]
MSRRLCRHAAPLSLLLTVSLALAGCQKESPQDSGQSPTEAPGSNELRPGDLSQVRALAARHGGVVALDLSDEAQYRFLRARVAAAGKTPEKYPQFFAMLQSVRERHAARRQGVSAQVSPEAPRDHLIGKVIVGPDGRTFEATAFSTVQGGADYSFLDVVVWDETQQNQVSDYGWGEVYADGRKLWARATGVLPLTRDPLLYVDSASLVSFGGQEYVLYKSATVSPSPGCDIVHPRDLAPAARPDNIVTICLQRNNGDCDYPLVNFQQVQIPLKGTMTFPFPVTSINNTPGTYAKLVEESGGPREMAFGTFFNWLTINPSDPRQVQWDIPQNQGVFTGVFFQPYEDVDLFMSIDVTMNRLGRPTQVTKQFSSSPTFTPSMVCMPKIQISYSCLAAGTQVKLAGGKSAPIERIAQGARVVTDGSGQALRVADTTVGTESIEMVRLRDDVGHDLLLTGTHPVMTPDRGVVWAEELKVGNRVLTDSGISTLVKADREMFAGAVHNLKLDRSSLQEKREAKGSTLYANGFLVGDVTMQRAYEFKDRAALTAELLARLPARWQVDYQSSLKAGTLPSGR